MNGLCVIVAVVLLTLAARCIDANHLLLAFLLAIGACEMIFHGAGMVGDHYTNVIYRNKPAADGPRYKALGNSMAVPVMRWIFERIHHTIKDLSL